MLLDISSSILLVFLNVERVFALYFLYSLDLGFSFLPLTIIESLFMMTELEVDLRKLKNLNT